MTHAECSRTLQQTPTTPRLKTIDPRRPDARRTLPPTRGPRFGYFPAPSYSSSSSFVEDVTVRVGGRLARAVELAAETRGQARTTKRQRSSRARRGGSPYRMRTCASTCSRCAMRRAGSPRARGPRRRSARERRETRRRGSIRDSGDRSPSRANSIDGSRRWQRTRMRIHRRIALSSLVYLADSIRRRRERTMSRPKLLAAPLEQRFGRFRGALSGAHVGFNFSGRTDTSRARRRRRVSDLQATWTSAPCAAKILRRTSSPWS